MTRSADRIRVLEDALRAEFDLSHRQSITLSRLAALVDAAREVARCWEITDCTQDPSFFRALTMLSVAVRDVAQHKEES